MPSAREGLVLENLRLVYYTYEKLAKSELTERHREDLIEEGMVGLVKAAASFDETRGIRFSTFAARCIRNEMLMYIRRVRKYFDREVSFWTPIGRDGEGNELCLADVLEDEKNNPEQVLTEIMLEDIIENAKPREQAILSAMKEGYRQKEAAMMCGVTPSSVSRYIDRLKRKYRVAVRD